MRDALDLGDEGAAVDARGATGTVERVEQPAWQAWLDGLSVTA